MLSVSSPIIFFNLFDGFSQSKNIFFSSSYFIFLNMFSSLTVDVYTLKRMILASGLSANNYLNTFLETSLLFAEEIVSVKSWNSSLIFLLSRVVT